MLENNLFPNFLLIASIFFRSTARILRVEVCKVPNFERLISNVLESTRLSRSRGDSWLRETHLQCSHICSLAGVAIRGVRTMRCTLRRPTQWAPIGDMVVSHAPLWLRVLRISSTGSPNCPEYLPCTCRRTIHETLPQLPHGPLMCWCSSGATHDRGNSAGNFVCVSLHRRLGALSSAAAVSAKGPRPPFHLVKRIQSLLCRCHRGP